MTVSSTTNRKTFTGDAVTTSFGTSPVVFFDTSDLVIYVVTTATGASTTLTENTHYTVTGGDGSTGTVNLAGGTSPYGAPAATQKLVILRVMPLTQADDFVNNDINDAEVLEDNLDKITMILQQHGDTLDRTLQLSSEDVTGADTDLPTPSANKLIGWNSAADGLANYSNSDMTGLIVSAFMQTVVDDSSASAALSTLYGAANSRSIVEGAAGNVWLWTRQLTGTPSIGAGALFGYSPSAYMFDVYTDNQDCSTDFSVNMRVRHRFGGSAAKGGRIAVYGSAELIADTHASNANRNYVGVQGSAYAISDDGGTNTGAGALGAIFGGGFAAYAPAAATNMLDIVGAEFDTFTQTGSSAKYVRGISINGCNAVRGATLDSAITIGGLAAVGVYGAHIGWKYGMIFTDENGADPFYASSILIGTQFQSTKTIATGIDLQQFTMTTILRGVKTILTEAQLTLGDTAGNATLAIDGASTNASLLLRSKGTGSIYFQGSDATNIFRGDRVASAVNYIAITPAVTTGSPGVSAVGTDSNIDLLLQGQGTGVLKFGTTTGSGDVVCNGYIAIKDAAGNARKLMLTA